MSVAIDVEGSEMLGREGGNFDNEMKGKVEEEGLHGLDKLLFSVSRERFKGNNDGVRERSCLLLTLFPFLTLFSSLLFSFFSLKTSDFNA